MSEALLTQKETSEKMPGPGQSVDLRVRPPRSVEDISHHTTPELHGYSVHAHLTRRN